MTQALPKSVRVVEVGPRDGLQNEARILPTERKVRLISDLAGSGLREIEIGSFVSTRWVPQLADSDDVARALTARPGVVFSALVPNVRGMDRALAAGVRSIAVFTAASETFNGKNINASIAESIGRFRPVLDMARRENVRVRGYVSTAFACPYEGMIAPEAVLRVTLELLDMGVDEVSIGDTVGAAAPRHVDLLLDRLLPAVPAARLAMHFHDTYGMAIANVQAALARGIVTFDASAGGIGGCPYAPGASGNVATEDLVYLLAGSGIETGVDIEKVSRAARAIEPDLGHMLPSRVNRALRSRMLDGAGR